MLLRLLALRVLGIEPMCFIECAESNVACMQVVAWASLPEVTIADSFLCETGT